MTPAGFFFGGQYLLGFRDDKVLIYNFSDHTIESTISMPARVVKAAISGDGKTIAAGMEDFSVLLINASDKKIINRIKIFSGNISGLVFSPSNDQLLVASEDSWVRTFSLDGQEIDAFQPTGGGDMPTSVMGIGVSPDWKMLATIPFDGKMNLWSLPAHTLLGSFEGSILGGYSNSQAAFSPNSQYLAEHLGAGGGNLSLWRISDGELLLRGENISTGVDFSPDGHFLAYGEMLPTGGSHIVLRSPDGTEVIYELLGTAQSMVGAPLFTPDSRFVVAIDYSTGSLLAWSTTVGNSVSLGEANCPME